jgi:exodeoxyribonuclease VII small subunit
MVSQDDVIEGGQAGAVSFEDALDELESLVKNLEGGKLTLEAALSSYQRGTELIRYCQHTLDHAEQKIQVLEAGMLQDFTPATDLPDPSAAT